MESALQAGSFAKIAHRAISLRLARLLVTGYWLPELAEA
jgi:hypothetical protein